MNGIQVKNLVKTYTTQSTDIILNGAKRPSTTRTVLHGVSVDFPAGKLTAILGRSGCGKSTLLRLIDGTKDAPDSGEIVMPEGWRCALLSPDPYVITWTSVERNVAMAAGAGRTPEERLELAKKLVKLVRLEDYADMTPVELSTGMRQRLGLARVLASQAQVLLMDEPFASLDFITRGELQAELLDIQKELQKTILLVTHQLDEALLLAFVGFGMGLEGKLKAMLRGAGLGIVLVPLAMVTGSLLAGVVYSFLSPMTLREGLAISAGFGWYTLAPSVISGAGHAVAGAVSFLHNVLRETLGIILLPLAASKIGCIEAVTLPGTCAMDVCLPIVERSCSAETLPYSFTTGMAACLFSALLVPFIMGV